MKWWQRILNKSPTDTGFGIQLITDRGNGFYSWNGNLYKSDIIRAAIRPKVKAIGKLLAVHVREAQGDLKINPDVYMKMLLEEPNPYSTGQMMQEKMATQLALNNNAFALIYRDANGYPVQLYPIPAISVVAIRKDDGSLFLKFTLALGKQLTVPYTDVIHLRDDFNDNDIFGSTKADALAPLMEIINASDQSIVNAVKNSSVIKWILKFKSSLRKEDRDMQVKDFVDSFLSVNNNGGAAYSDPRYDLEQVKNTDYVPNTSQQKEAVQRIYSFFNTNDKIVQSKYNEDEWIAYYESQIEPDAVQMSGEYSRKLFSRRERGHGNKIVFESSNLAHASMKTKLDLVKMVDRGAMTPNEWRRLLNMGPIEGGDSPVRRLDTIAIKGEKGGEGEE